MPYRVVHETPTVTTYLALRASAGLSAKSLEAATVGLSNGLFSVVVYAGGSPVGMGRVIGDGGCFFVISDIAVAKEHQQRGLGRQIMEHLMAWVHENAPPTAYVMLMASHGTPEFYKKFGFEAASPPERAGMFLRMV